MKNKMKEFITTISSWDGWNNRWCKDYTPYVVKAVNAKEAKKKCVEMYLRHNCIDVTDNNNRCFSVTCYEKTGRATAFNVVANNEIVGG